MPKPPARTLAHDERARRSLRGACRPPIVRVAALSELAGVAHGISTRHGGASVGPFASLNLGLHVGDDPVAVVENRRRVGAALGLPLEHLVFASQVHGGEVAVVGREHRGRGVRDHATAIPGADALVTDARGVGLVVLVADCAPILLADPVAGAIGVVHAGWRGLAVDVAGRAVRTMAAALGTRPADVRAVIGPCIGAADYAVGGDVVEVMAARFGAPASAWFSAGDGGARSLDLAAAARDQLRWAGVVDARIQTSVISTAVDERFYSHRASGGRTGRFGGVIALVP